MLADVTVKELKNGHGDTMLYEFTVDTRFIPSRKLELIKQLLAELCSE